MRARTSQPIVASFISALVLTILSAALSTTSISMASPVQQVQPQTVTIAAGGTATLKVRGFCLAFGKPFPTGSMIMDGLASDGTRQALAYAIQKGYTDSNAQQVQEAIWYLQDKTWHNTEHVIGQEIVDNAATVGTIPIGSGTALNNPAAQSTLTMTVLFVLQTADAFYGDGDLQIKNSGTAEMKVYLPIGAKFTVPAGNGTFQDLIVYALQAATGTPTVATTPTTAATVTVAVATTLPIATTEVATSEPTQTQLPAATPTTAPAPVDAPLPATGGPTDGLLLGYVLLALGCGLAGIGLIMRLRLRR